MYVSQQQEIRTPKSNILICIVEKHNDGKLMVTCKSGKKKEKIVLESLIKQLSEIEKEMQ